MRNETTSDLLLELQGYRLTTAEIIYRLPDFPELLQSFVWQSLDLAPDYPRLQAFLTFWQDHIEGDIHSVKVTQSDVIGISEFRNAKDEFTLH